GTDRATDLRSKDGLYVARQRQRPGQPAHLPGIQEQVGALAHADRADVERLEARAGTRGRVGSRLGIAFRGPAEARRDDPIRRDTRLDEGSLHQWVGRQDVVVLGEFFLLLGDRRRRDAVLWLETDAAVLRVEHAL